jgi:hypothetical protein
MSPALPAAPRRAPRAHRPRGAPGLWTSSSGPAWPAMLQPSTCRRGWGSSSGLACKIKRPWAPPPARDISLTARRVASPGLASIGPGLAERERRRDDPPTWRRFFAGRPGHRAVTRELRTASDYRREAPLTPPCLLHLTETTAYPADLYVGPRFNQPSAWAVKSAGLGDDGARPEVGWVPLEMDEPPVPWQLRGTVH